MKIIYKLSIVCVMLVALCACEDFLDELPDNRTQLDASKKIRDLMVNAYPTANYWALTELSSDNFIDNRAPDEKGISYQIDAIERMDDEIFAWQDVVSSSDKDAPYDVWAKFYHSIAVCNHALEAIDLLEAEQNLGAVLNPQRGEALVLRAYCHFMLANIFCKTYKDDEVSKNDLGIPYKTKPGKTVGVVSDRGNLADVYAQIEKDIEAGIELIDDETYEVAKYHFNKNAAHAFAARFYLYKRDYEKVVKYANVVLGEGKPATLRNWNEISGLSLDQQPYGYASADVPANLMFIPTYSAFFRRFQNYRYGVRGEAMKGSIGDSGPTWSSRPPHLNGMVVTYKQDYGSFANIIQEYFEFTNKVAKIGWAHCERIEYTTDALLLDRAEAYIFLNRIPDAVADLQYWNESHRSTTELTASRIESFYTPGKANFSYEFHTTELSPKFLVTAEQKPYVDCVLHFRRIERIHQGDRWFDLKRYGIEVTHVIGSNARKEVLTYDDDRRAIQIPLDVIGAGLEENIREIREADQSLVLELYVNEND